ncbi:MAG TPA: hypothetical protein VHZ55_15350 [Bryobacteraceae bacterium]|jgi:hypothetical protein|nr:hypothetical protein [Bryobacteraceae bacterium]
MSEPQDKSTQPDKNLADEERPVPSQAEGDRETVEEDLKEKETKGSATKK